MLEEIKDNLGKMTKALSIVAAALLVPSILAGLEGALTEANVVLLVQYALLLSACIVLFLPKKEGRCAIAPANVLFYGALAFRQIYNALSGGLAFYATAALYLATAVLVFFPSCKKAFGLASLISVAFFLAAALGGGAVNLSILLTSLLLAANYYLIEEKE